MGNWCLVDLSGCSLFLRFVLRKGGAGKTTLLRAFI